MTKLERAEKLRQEAITILVEERDQIDAQLAQLGFNGQTKSPSKKRGPKPKQPSDADVFPIQTPLDSHTA